MRLREKTLRRLLRRTAVAAAIVALVALVALWLAFQRKPAWYRPVTLDETGIQRARRDLSNLTDWVGDQLVRRKPFDLTLREEEVNAWLAALPHIWPDAAQRMKPDLSDPAVAFTNDDVRIGVELASTVWRVIASVAVSLSVTADGASLEIIPSPPCGGSLPIPRFMLDAPLARALERVREEAPRNGLRKALQRITTPNDLFAGIRIPNRFVWPNGRRAFRITEIQSEDGRLRLGIEPL